VGHWQLALSLSHPLSPTLPALTPPSQQAILEWEEKEHERQQALASSSGAPGAEADEADEQQFVAFVPLPDQKAIELRVLEKKKQDLLAK
jgi:pre-mRNA-splicing factor ISY1